jgi:prepilin peptidase CpaA
VLAAGALATLIDVRTRRIPNWLTAATTAAGLMTAYGGGSGISVASSMVGVLVGGALMLPGHTLGATGAGDVKLLAAFGSVLGPQRIVIAFLYMAIAGGLFAIVVAFKRGSFQTTVCRTARLLVDPVATRDKVRAVGSGNAFPYGPAIALGCLLAVFGRM